jgi:hypothetical protein
MLCSKLIIALCDTEDEVNKFVHFNQRESLVRYMQDFTFGYKHVCGTPKPNANYLMCDVQLDGAVPDLMFEHKSKRYTSYFYGYQMEEPAMLTGTAR